MNNLGVGFGDAFGLSWGFRLDLWKNGRNQQIWAISGSYAVV